jgi:PAS domain S-box-containing protein
MKVVTMPDTNVENQRRLDNTELNRRIALLEETLLEKKMLTENLQDSEKRYRRLFESAKDGILILDADTGRVADVNPYLLQLLGYTYDALFGQYIWELGAFKDIAASKDAFKTLQDNEYIRYDDLPLETSDGRPISVEFVSNVYLVDHTKVIQCNIRDITDRKRQNESLLRTQFAMDRASDSILWIDDEGYIVYANDSACTSTGYTREELLTLKVFDIVPDFPLHPLP